MKKPKRFDNFLYRHFKRTGHPPTKVSVQPVEITTYDEHFTARFKIIKRHETELKLIKLLQSKKISNDQELIQSDPISISTGF